MLRWLLADSAGHFWQPEEFENVANTAHAITKPQKFIADCNYYYTDI